MRTIQLFVALLVITIGLGSLSAAAQNPITAAREAFRKSMEEQKRKQEEQKKQQTRPPAQGASPQPVTLDDLTTTPAPVAPVDPKVMPDIVGIHLGMSLKEAEAALRAQYPKGLINIWDGGMPTIPKVILGASHNYGLRDVYGDQVNFSVTLPPENQVVWSVDRMAQRQHVNRATLLAALRKKYGKEAFAGFSDGNLFQRATNDAEIIRIVWLYDEQGRPAPLPSSGVSALDGCGGSGGGQTSLWQNQPRLTEWCASSYIAVTANFGGPQEIIEVLRMEMVHRPLAVRTTRAATAWSNAAVEKLQREEIEKSKAKQPKL